MRLIVFKMTLICFLVVSVFARTGDEFAEHGLEADTNVDAQITQLMATPSLHESGFSGGSCACEQLPGSEMSITCGVVLALPADCHKLDPPNSATGKLTDHGSHGLKLFLPIQKKPPRTIV